MSTEKPTPPRAPEVEATAAMRGYVHQFLVTLDMLFCDPKTQEVYVETFEDILRITTNGFEPIQVKARTGVFSLTQVDALEMLERWAAFAQDAPSARFLFVSTQDPGNLHDRSDAFKRWATGAQDDATFNALYNSLRAFLSSRADPRRARPSQTLQLAKSIKDLQIPNLRRLMQNGSHLRAFLDRIRWQFASPPLDAVFDKIVAEVQRCDSLSAHAARFRVYGWLGAIALSASSTDVNERRWERSRLQSVLGERHERLANATINLFEQRHHEVLEAIAMQGAEISEKIAKLELAIRTVPSDNQPQMGSFGNLPNHLSPPFVGRIREIDEATAILQGSDGPVVIIVGPSGVGKTRLAFEVGKRLKFWFDNLVYYVDARRDLVGDLARLGASLNLVRIIQEPLTVTASRLLATLCASRSLIIYDDVPSLAALDAAMLPPPGKCAVMITTTNAYWPAGYKLVKIGALNLNDENALIDEIIRDPMARDQVRRDLRRRAEGITVHLVAEARAIDYEVSHGRVAMLSKGPSSEASSSFERAWMSLDPAGQTWLRLAALFRADRTPLDRPKTLMHEAGWSAPSIQDAADLAADHFLVEVHGGRYRMHSLIIEFARAQKSPSLPNGVGQHLLKALLRSVSAYLESAADPERRQRLFDFVLELPFWDDLGVISDDDRLTFQRVGNCLIEAGRFQEARYWLERAVVVEDRAATRDGDAAGWIHHAIGFCLMELDQLVDAMVWYERAVAAKQLGDALGVVNHDNVGRSMHRVGHCLFRLKQYEQARKWFDKATQEKEFGDRDGKVNHVSIGWDLYAAGRCWVDEGRFMEALPRLQIALKHARQEGSNDRGRYELAAKTARQLGLCFLELSQVEEALTWFRDSIDAAGQGDILGRIDWNLHGDNMVHIGDCCLVLGDIPRALESYERSVEAKRRGDVFGRVYGQSLAFSLCRIGECHRRVGNLAAAEEAFRRAEDARREGDHWENADRVRADGNGMLQPT